MSHGPESHHGEDHPEKNPSTEAHPTPAPHPEAHPTPAPHPEAHPTPAPHPEAPPTPAPHPEAHHAPAPHPEAHHAPAPHPEAHPTPAPHPEAHPTPAPHPETHPKTHTKKTPKSHPEVSPETKPEEPPETKPEEHPEGENHPHPEEHPKDKAHPEDHSKSHPAHPKGGAHEEHDSHGTDHKAHSAHGHEGTSMWDKFAATMTTTAKNTWDTLVHIDDPNHDPITETKEVSGLMTPVKMVKSMIRGSVTNVLKRAAEVASPVIDAGEAAFYTVTSPILHPIETADNFSDYLSHPKRIITSTAKAVKNVLKAPFTLANEAYQGMVQRPLEQLNHKVKKFPLIGGLIAGVSNTVAKVLGWPLKTLDKFAKGATSWVDELDEKAKAGQSCHLAKTNYSPTPVTVATA